MKKEAEANADADLKIKEEVEKVNAADTLIFQTEKQLTEYGDKISEEKKKPIDEALAELKTAHAAKDLTTMIQQWKIKPAFQAASKISKKQVMAMLLVLMEMILKPKEMAK